MRLNKLRDEAQELPEPVRSVGGGRVFETTREQRVAAAVALRKTGLSMAKIGARIGVTASTVQMYLNPAKYERQNTLVQTSSTWMKRAKVPPRLHKTADEATSAKPIE